MWISREEYHAMLSAIARSAKENQSYSEIIVKLDDRITDLHTELDTRMAMRKTEIRKLQLSVQTLISVMEIYNKIITEQKPSKTTKKSTKK
jgi:hypothetical protein